MGLWSSADPHHHPCYPQEAECKKEMLDVKFMADTKIADSKRAFELQKSAFSEEVNIKVRRQKSPGIGLGCADCPLTYQSSCHRQLRPSWPMSYKGPESSRRSGRKRLRLRWYSARSRLPWRPRRSSALTRSSSPPCAALQRQRPTASSRSLKEKSESLGPGGRLVRPLSEELNTSQPQLGSYAIPISKSVPFCKADKLPACCLGGSVS